MIRIYQRENDEKEKASKIIGDLVEKNIKYNSVMIRATPIMETLTGVMIAGFIFFWKLIASGELEVNNFFIFSSNDVSLSTYKIFSHNKYDSLSRWRCF